jgi:N-methylhydantoinase A/oxoprolinase/acetone carboxylase beta subunit
VDLLREGPLPVPEILQKLGLLHVGQSQAAELLRQEVIGKAGLTPTDLLHAEGRHTPWNAEAAELALTAFSKFLFTDPADIVERVWRKMTEDIVRSLVLFLTDMHLPDEAPAARDIGTWFFENSLYDTHPHLETQFRLRDPIIGIGAPAGIFLQAVADHLHTALLLPEHYGVANAVGAIAGSVMVTEEILIYPHLSSAGLDVIGYYVQSGEGREEYEELDQALDIARQRGHDLALNAALRSGADSPEVLVEIRSDGIDTYRLRAQAMGNPRLSG